jgi:hypothetical protein
MHATYEEEDTCTYDFFMSQPPMDVREQHISNTLATH